MFHRHHEDYNSDLLFNVAFFCLCKPLLFIVLLNCVIYSESESVNGIWTAFGGSMSVMEGGRSGFL